MEKKSRKTYTQEFKIEALDLAKRLDNFAAAARQLGISDSLLYSWKDQLKFDGKSKLSGSSHCHRGSADTLKPYGNGTITGCGLVS